MRGAYLVAGLLALGSGVAFIYLRRSTVPALERTGTHRVVESQYRLSDAQRASLPSPSSGTVLVFRFLDVSGVWQIAVGEGPMAGAQAVMPIGLLFREPSGPEVDVPLYHCEFDSKSRGTSLDASSACAGEGRLLDPNPVGYVSRQIRTGFLLIYRCLSRERGRYISLNPRCEGPADLLDQPLGAILAAEN